MTRSATTADHDAAMTLDKLKPGQSATVTGIDGDGPLAQRLMTMGLVEGSHITVTRKALGGDPLEIDVMGYSLSLRRQEARQVRVSRPGHAS